MTRTHHAVKAPQRLQEPAKFITLQHESDLDTVLFTLSETAFRCGLKRFAREGGALSSRLHTVRSKLTEIGPARLAPRFTAHDLGHASFVTTDGED